MHCESPVKPSETVKHEIKLRQFGHVHLWPRGLTLSQDTCSICMNCLISRGPCCRLVCKHVFHYMYACELLQHVSQVMERDIRTHFPTCPKDAVIDRSWTPSAFESQTKRMTGSCKPDAVAEQDASLMMLRIRKSMEHQRRKLILHSVLRWTRILSQYRIPRQSATRTAS